MIHAVALFAPTGGRFPETVAFSAEISEKNCWQYTSNAERRHSVALFPFFGDAASSADLNAVFANPYTVEPSPSVAIWAAAAVVASVPLSPVALMPRTAHAFLTIAARLSVYASMSDASRKPVVTVIVSPLVYAFCTNRAVITE